MQNHQNPAETLSHSRDIYVERKGAVATIVLDRPQKHNAVTLEMWLQIPVIMNALSKDDSLRCVILRGAGERAFSSGCDISEFSEVRSNREQGIIYGKAMQDALLSLYECRHPLIAQVHGLCLGAGVELLATCDIRICGESSTFGIPAKNLGLVLSHAELKPLLELVGQDTLKEMLLEGRIFSAGEACFKKLVTRVVPDEAVEKETEASVRRITGGAPLAARWHKKFVRRLAEDEPLSAEEYMEGFECYETQDYATGCAAFFKKEIPEFSGK